MINKVFLIGNVGKDPVLEYLPSGTAILKFSVATTENYKDDDEWKQKTEWHNIVAFGNLANFKTSKGAMVWIEGSTSTSTYEKDGVKHYRTSVNAKFIKNLTNKKDEEPL